LEFLTIFLNSKLFKFAYKDYFPELLGQTREVRKVFFENVAIKPWSDVEWCKRMLTNIQSATKERRSINHLENEIDNKLFELYELTGSERSIVMGDKRPWELTRDKSLAESE
jgi:hypothetical protein